MLKKLLFAFVFLSALNAYALDITVHVDDSNVDTLSRRLGWTDTISQGLLGGPQVPNPVSQSQWIANAVQTYNNNELTAAIVNPAQATAQQQAIATATQDEALNSVTVTSASKIPPVVQQGQVTPN